MSHSSIEPKQLLRRALSKDSIIWFLMLNLGLFLSAVGIHFFKSPNHFAFGGTSGLSVILADLFPTLRVGDFMFLLNIALVILGLAFLGRKAMGATVYSSIVLSAFVSLCERVYPMPTPFTDDTLLELCFGVLLPAAGAAIVFNLGASTGGTDIIAMILAKYTDLKIGSALLVSDVAIVVAGGVLFGAQTFLYCVAGLFSKSFVVDSMIERINLRKQMTIITDNPEPIKDFILTELHRGATEQIAHGAYTDGEITVLFTVLSRHQAIQLRNFLHSADPHAFLTIVNSSEVIGNGFSSL